MTQSHSTKQKMNFDIMSLKKRADFLRLRHGRFVPCKGFLVQAMPNESKITRVGFTASKKIGNAVTRNRAKRRLRVISQEAIRDFGKLGWDYVFIAKPNASVNRDFDQLQNDAAFALKKIHKAKS